MDVERDVEPATASSEGTAIPDSIRITRHGKFRVWVEKALDFFQSHPSRPLVLYSAPADVSASTIARLISVVEIIKREYLKGRDISAGDASGLHQYNRLLSEDRKMQGNALQVALDGHSHLKQTLAPHMSITLCTQTLVLQNRATHQPAAVRRMSKAAKARMRKRARKLAETGDGAEFSCQSCLKLVAV